MSKNTESAAEIVERGGKRFIVDPVEGPLEIKYGLPGEVKFCRNCIISNQRPSSSVEFEHRAESLKKTIRFDENGVCDACNFAKMKEKAVDWEQRKNQLVELCDKYRSRNSSYDCLVPGSGGKDSVYASHILKTKYDMHPLTVTWSPHLYTDVGWRNFQGWLHKGGFDNFLFTPDGQVHRTLTQLAFRNLLHPFQPFIFGQKNFAPKMATRFGIPLVIYGENEAEYGNPIDQNLTATRDLSYFARSSGGANSMFFGGVSLEDLSQYGIEPQQMEPYMPAETDDLGRNEIAVHYLGYYLKWTPQECYYYAVEHTDFEANTERTEGTYSKYNSIDDKTDPYHYWTTLVKFGIGRTTYDASQEIRNHHITREEGVSLAHRYDQEFPIKFFGEFLEYLDMEKDEFFEVSDRFRSPHLWHRTAKGWELRHVVS